jgi:hypothetical protein
MLRAFFLAEPERQRPANFNPNNATSDPTPNQEKSMWPVADASGSETVVYRIHQRSISGTPSTIIYWIFVINFLHSRQSLK